MIGASLLGAGLLFFILNRSTATFVAADLFVALFGIVCILVPLVNMLTTSIPRENVAVGLGMNTMLRNLGGAYPPSCRNYDYGILYYQRYFTLEIGLNIRRGVPERNRLQHHLRARNCSECLGFVISLATKNYTFKPVVSLNPGKQSSPK